MWKRIITYFHKQSNRNTYKIQIKIEQTVANNGRPEEDLKRECLSDVTGMLHVSNLNNMRCMSLNKLCIVTKPVNMPAWVREISQGPS